MTNPLDKLKNKAIDVKNKAIDAGIDALKYQLSKELKNYGIRNPDIIMESIKLEEKSMTHVTGIIDLIKLNEDGGISKLLNEFIVHLAPKSQIDHITKLVVSEIMKMENTAFKFSVKLGTPPQYNIDFVNVVTFNNDNYSINIANIFKGIDVDTIIGSVVEYVSQIENLDDTAKKRINELLGDDVFKTRLTELKEGFVSKSVEIKGSVKTIYRDIEEAINIMKQNQDNKTGGMNISSVAEKISETLPEVGKLLNTSERQPANGLTAADNSNQTGLTSSNDGDTRGGAGPYMFTLEAPDVPEAKIKAINQEICKMISNSLNSELDTFKKTLGGIAKTALQRAEAELIEKMKERFINGLEEKLMDMEDKIVNTVESEDLIQNIVVGMGLKFNEALEHKQDSSMIEFYAAYNNMLKEKDQTNAPPPPPPAEGPDPGQDQGQGEGNKKNEVPGGELNARVKMRMDKIKSTDGDNAKPIGDGPLGAKQIGDGQLGAKTKRDGQLGGRKTKRKNKTKRKKQNKTKRKRT